MHGLLSSADTSSGTYITAQRGDKDVDILTRMKNKQKNTVVAFLKVRDRGRKSIIRPCLQIYMHETDGGVGNQEWKMEMLDGVKSSIHKTPLGTSLRTGSFTVKAMIFELHQKHHLPYLKCQHSKNK